MVGCGVTNLIVAQFMRLDYDNPNSFRTHVSNYMLIYALQLCFSNLICKQLNCVLAANGENILHRTLLKLFAGNFILW